VPPVTAMTFRVYAVFKPFQGMIQIKTVNKAIDIRFIGFLFRSLQRKIRYNLRLTFPIYRGIIER